MLKLIILLLVSTSLLTGCANWLPPVTKQVHIPQADCQHSNLLISNLSKPIGQRHYQLVNGTACRELHHANIREK